MLAPQQGSVFLWHLAATAGGWIVFSCAQLLPTCKGFVCSLSLSPLTDNQCARRKNCGGIWIIKRWTFPPEDTPVTFVPVLSVSA